MTTRERILLLSVLTVIVVGRCAAVWISDGVVATDSSRYRDSSDPLSTFRAWEGRGPGVLAQLWFLLPLKLSLGVQTLVTSVTWSIACWAAVQGARPRTRLTVALLMIGWMCSPWFVLWDAWVLTESAALAGCAVAAVGAARLAMHAGGPWLMVAGVLFATAARPFTLLVLAPLVLVAFLLASRASRRIAAVSVLLVIAVLGGANAVAFEKLSTYGQDERHVESLRAAGRLAVRGHLPGYLDSAHSAGMPSCPSVEREVLAPSPDMIDVWTSDCPGFGVWLEAGGLPWRTELAKQPAATLAAFADPVTWTREPLNPYWQLDGRYFRASEVVGSRWPGLLHIVNAAMWLLMALVIVWGISGQQRVRRFTSAVITICVAVAFVSWLSDGLEYWRHILPVVVVVLPSVVVARTVTRRVEPLLDEPAASDR